MLTAAGKTKPGTSRQITPTTDTAAYKAVRDYLRANATPAQRRQLTAAKCRTIYESMLNTRRY